MFKPNKKFDNNEEYYNKDQIEKPIMNYEIKHYKIRLINELGENEGIVTVKEGIAKAKEKLLDLIEINPNAMPPVCKIMDLGKYLFEAKKHKKEIAQKSPEIHEIRLSPSISDHDLEIKSKKTLEFLNNNCKVIIQFKLKGREAKKIDIIKGVVNKFYNLLKDHAILKNESESFILIPKSKENIINNNKE